MDSQKAANNLRRFRVAARDRELQPSLTHSDVHMGLALPLATQLSFLAQDAKLSLFDFKQRDRLVLLSKEMLLLTVHIAEVPNPALGHTSAHL